MIIKILRGSLTADGVGGSCEQFGKDSVWLGLSGLEQLFQDSLAVLTQRGKAPSRAGVAAALATGVATATLTHAGAGNAAPG